MLYIFADNFRGFKETVLPLRDVNFFVGENSAGKTSIMALINVLESPYFWVGQKFGAQYIDFGSFDDIVSIYSQNRSYFNVGVLEVKQEDEGEKKCAGFLTTFVERSGMPRIHRYSFVKDNREIQIRFTGSKVLYKVHEGKPIPDDNESVKKLFLEWVDNHRRVGRNFNQIKAPPRALRNIGAINALFEDEIEVVKEVEKDSISVQAGWVSHFHDIKWIAPIRTKPERTYDKQDVSFSPEGEHTPYVIRRILRSKKIADEFSQFVGRFGRESGLFDKIEIRQYGRSSSGPFELKIVLHDKSIRMVDVGYGVSQVLPLIVEMFRGSKGTWYTIQQPEIHIHPKAQAAIGDAIYQLAQLENKGFIVETHSDYIIDRFRTNYDIKGQEKKPESQIVYFERSGEGNEIRVIEILEDGTLPSDQPRGYREFFIKEDLRVLGY